LGHALDEARRDGTSLAILSLDLDGFKRVNDTLGHAAGDVLLKEVARRVSSCIRSTDVVGRGEVGTIERQLTADSIACRLGGDEFVVALTRVGSRENAALVAQRIADRLASPFAIAGNEVFVSSSIGIASFPDCNVDVETLLERADAAMYHAKESGRNQYQFFSSDIQERARKRLVVENALRAALERSGIHRHSRSTVEVDRAACEFRLEYQPKVEIPSGGVLGAEALLRWTSPELGAVPPVDFIGIAEETGLIVPLGAWVLNEACEQAQAWAAEGSERALRVAVNVSARQFRDPAFPELVARTLERTGLAPESLELEITEGMVMQDTVGSRKMLGDLKALGVRIALDDFGTGYSSLSYLTKLPIDAIKIDRSFIRDLDDTVRSATITSAIIGLSRGLDIDVVVEGVETQAQLDFVSKHGSSEIQGYLFAKPMSAERLDEWRATRDAGAGPLSSVRPIKNVA
jgi:predicted signal transduction protein with EAL and GGDEF domain